jgi:hypothetical protein
MAIGYLTGATGLFIPVFVLFFCFLFFKCLFCPLSYSFTLIPDAPLSCKCVRNRKTSDESYMSKSIRILCIRVLRGNSKIIQPEAGCFYLPCLK